MSGDHPIHSSVAAAEAFTDLPQRRDFPHVRVALLFLALSLPWLNPFAPGPSPSVVPWLFSVVCALAAWLLARTGQAPLGAPQAVPVIAASWLAAAVVSSVLGLLQYFGAALPLAPWVSPAEAGEAYGNLRQTNQFASLMSIGVAALLWWAPRLRSPALWASLALLVSANAASASRTGLLQLVLLLVLAAGWPSAERRLRVQLGVAALGLYVLATLLLPVLLSEATGVVPRSIWLRVAAEEGCSSRLVLWSNVLTLIQARPWLGWGWGELDFAHFITLYDGPRFCAILDNAHNLPLHLAVELGLPQAFACCALFAWWAWRKRPWREADAARQLAWSVLAIILVHSMLEYPLWYGPFQIAAGLCLLLLRDSRAATASERPIPRLTKSVEFGLVVALLAVVSAAAWDYWRVSQIYLPPQSRAERYRMDPLRHVGRSSMFSSQLQFAVLTITPLTAANAQHMHDVALELLHYSPEPRVAEKVIESALLLGREDEVSFYAARYKAAFPKEYKQWLAEHAAVPAPRP